MRTRLGVALATIVLVVSTETAASADIALVDAGPTVALDAIPCHLAALTSVPVAVERSSSGAVYGPGAVLTAQAVSPDSQVQARGRSPVTLPSGWPTFVPAGTRSDAIPLDVAVTPVATGTFSRTLDVRVTGASASNPDVPVTNDVPLVVTWSADCGPNAPVPSSTLNQGAFQLAWPPATDATGVYSYELEGANALGVWHPLAADLQPAEYSFTAGSPSEEGTWQYRARSVREAPTPRVEGDWSGPSVPVVVDRTAPNAPTATADRAAEYTASGGTNWWKDSVTVTFADNGDPNLPDTSAGSGVDAATVPAAQTYDAQGAFTATGTVKDRAGNESQQGSLAGSVDTVAPVLSATCPMGPFILGSSASVPWSATDDGGSGVAGAASGEFTLDTAAPGHHDLTIPAVKDNVGHVSNAVICEDGYTVIYDFAGFFSPVSIDKTNSAKAGSGVPIKFSLGGDRGLNVVTTATFTPTGTGESGTDVPTVTAGQSSLQYDPTTGQYTYVWKTDKAWAGKSGTFTLTLDDGTTHTAKFTFK